MFEREFYQRSTVKSFFWFSWVLSPLFFSFLASAKPQTLILVDKSTRTLEVAEYELEQYRILKTFRTTIGKVKGDKQVEGDLKTPEGIYTLTSLLRPPNLKPKFGVMAFYMNYPNPFDKMAGRTGFDIMLHATDDPSRLELELDSEGCIVVGNEELQQIKPYVRLGLTPILVFHHLDDSFRYPKKHERLVDFTNTWLKNWQEKKMDDYIKAYHSEFTNEGRNKNQWREYKASLNKRYSDIRINPSEIMILPHPKYFVIQFKQNYESRLKSGVLALRSIGTKTLYVAEEEGELRIIDEDFSRLVW